MLLQTKSNLDATDFSILTRKWWQNCPHECHCFLRCPSTPEINLTTHTHFITHYCLYNIRCSRYIQQKICSKRRRVYEIVAWSSWRSHRFLSHRIRTVGQSSAWQLMRRLKTDPLVHLRSLINKGEKSADAMFSVVLWDHLHPSLG